jgi:hypothetical protein
MIITVLAGRAASEPSPTATAVMTPNIIHACYTSAGTLYLIKQPGLGQSCLANHIEISWNVVGPQGPQGEQGPPGPSGVSGYEIKTGSHPVPPGVQELTVECPPGKLPLGGGFTVPGIDVRSSEPHGNGWRVTTATLQHGLFAFAVCAFVSQ